MVWPVRRHRGTLWISIAAGLALLLAITNIVLVELNRRVQADVSARNQLLQQRVQLEALTRELLSAIANLAVQRNDEAMKKALTDHGITLNPPAGAARGPAMAPEPAPRR